MAKGFRDWLGTSYALSHFIIATPLEERESIHPFYRWGNAALEGSKTWCHGVAELPRALSPGYAGAQ